MIEPRKDESGWATVFLDGGGETCVLYGLAREATPGSESGASARGLPRNLGDPMHSVETAGARGLPAEQRGLACGVQREAAAGANDDARHGTGGEG